MTQMYQRGTPRFILDINDRIPFFAYTAREDRRFYILAITARYLRLWILSFTIFGYDDNIALHDTLLRCWNCVLRSKARVLPNLLHHEISVSVRFLASAVS
jgi:hypothetical protein